MHSIKRCSLMAFSQNHYFIAQIDFKIGYISPHIEFKIIYRGLTIVLQETQSWSANGNNEAGKAWGFSWSEHKGHFSHCWSWACSWSCPVSVGGPRAGRGRPDCAAGPCWCLVDGWRGVSAGPSPHLKKQKTKTQPNEYLNLLKLHMLSSVINHQSFKITMLFGLQGILPVMTTTTIIVWLHTSIFVKKKRHFYCTYCKETTSTSV